MACYLMFKHRVCWVAAEEPAPVILIAQQEDKKIKSNFVIGHK
jgi:hypothetical protein